MSLENKDETREEARPVSLRKDVIAAAVCVVFGLVMSLLPYGLWWPEVGEPFWVADHDEIYYLQIAARAYFNNPTHLSDPMGPLDSGSVFPTITFVPAIISARLLGAGPLGIAFCWRVGSGIGMGLMMYLVLRQVLGRPFLAMVLACLLLSDCGLLTCHLLFKQWLNAAKLLSGRTGALLASNPRIHSEWRVVNPGPSLPFLLLHVWLMIRARQRPTALRIAVAGLGVGLLFYVYFYFFTAVSVALVVALALDAGHRKVYFHAGWIGALIGLPSVAFSFLFQRSTSHDWMTRSDKFLPVPHLSHLMIPTVACVLLGLGVIWVVRWRRDLSYVAILGAVGLCLANHHVVTGLEIENFHWIYVWGSMISLLTVLLVAGALCGRVGRSRGIIGVLLGFWAVHLALGVWLRGVEATRSRECIELAADYARYRADRRAAGSEALLPNAVIAGDVRFVEFATILERQTELVGYATVLSPYIDNDSWNDRIALNAYLLGQGRPEFEAIQRHDLETTHWGPWARDSSARQELFAKRLESFDRVEKDGTVPVERFGVRYIALPSGQELPDALRPSWKKARDGTTWDLWEKAGEGQTRVLPDPRAQQM